MRWGESGQFFEASGIGKQTGSYFQPVAGRMSSQFGMRRHPILGYMRMHSGIDYAASYGSPIVAVSDGIVSYAGRHGGHGKYVRIEHGGALGSGYAHMSSIAVAQGAPVVPCTLFSTMTEPGGSFETVATTALSSNFRASMSVPKFE